MKVLSAIVPCYNEEDNIADFYQEFIKNEQFFGEKEIELELWYINDGSKDQTAAAVRKLIEKDGRVHLLSFSRNFGKEAAINAGLEKAKGDYVCFWMQICRIRRRFCRKCSVIWKKGMIRWLPDVSTARGNRLCALFLPGLFTG